MPSPVIFLSLLKLWFLTRVTWRSWGFAELVCPSSFWSHSGGAGPGPGSWVALAAPGIAECRSCSSLPPARLHLHKHGAFLEISFAELILAFGISSRGRSVELALFWRGEISPA